MIGKQRPVKLNYQVGSFLIAALFSILGSFQSFGAQTDTTGFAFSTQMMKGRHRTYDLAAQFRHPVPFKTVNMRNKDEFGVRRFYIGGAAVIGSWHKKGPQLYEGTYWTNELQFGFSMGRHDRNYFYKTYHSNDSQYFDRYIFDETRDELYLSVGKNIVLPLGNSFYASSGLRISVQQSVHASGSYLHMITFKVKGSQAYDYTVDIRNPDDIFGRTKIKEEHQGTLKPGTALLAEIPVVLGWKPGKHVSLIADFRWGLGASFIWNSKAVYKSLYGMGIGVGYSL